MKLITENPYRIVGVLSNTTEKDLLKQKSKIKRFREVGKAITSEYDFSFLEPISRKNGNIEKLFSDVEQNQDKVNHALFWFLNDNEFDEIAINHLKAGDKEKAIETWEKITDGKEVNSKNYSAFNNIGTLHLLGRTKQDIKKGIEAKIKLLESDYYRDFAHAVADEIFTINQDKQIEIFIDKIIAQHEFREYLPTEIVALFKDSGKNVQLYINKKFTDEPIRKIKFEIEQSKKERNREGSDIYNLGIKLYYHTQDELILLKSILGVEDFYYKTLTNRVAEEILVCSIAYFEKNKKEKITDSIVKQAIQLAKKANQIAIDRIIKKDIQVWISNYESFKDKELNQAIALLEFIQKEYDNVYYEIIRLVKKELGINNGSLGRPWDIAMPIFDNYGRPKKTINYAEVRKAARESLDNDKLLELINKTITNDTLKKIAKSEDEKKIDKFYRLLKTIDTEIISLDFKKKEDVLFNELLHSSVLYQSILKQKQEEKKLEEAKKQREKEQEEKRIENQKKAKERREQLEKERLEKEKKRKQKEAKEKVIRGVVKLIIIIAIFVIVGLIFGEDGIGVLLFLIMSFAIRLAYEKTKSS